MLTEPYDKIFHHSFDIILDFAALTEDTSVREPLEQYLLFPDKTEYNDMARKLRREAIKACKTLYEAVFFQFIENKNRPIPVVLFLLFGFLSEKDFKEEQLQALLKAMKEVGNATHIYTFFEWLVLIKSGKIEPSVNDFSLDYAAFLRQQIKMGELDASDYQKEFDNIDARIHYEIENAFSYIMRTLAESPATYCPILTPEKLVRDVPNALLSKEYVKEEVHQIRQVDATVFYRECLYSHDKLPNGRYYLQKEIEPDIILLPFSGAKGIMWQETVGANRQSAARFFFPILLNDNLRKHMITACANYRWELCKRIEGGRWMDSTLHSLTGEYYDYISTYKKNTALSSEAKEKIKNELARHNKNPKGVFVADYLLYLQYESTGAIRLNKVARELLFKHCPFSREICEGNALKNASYEKYIQIRQHRKQVEKNKMEAVFRPCVNEEGELPKEMQEHLNYYDL